MKNAFIILTLLSVVVGFKAPIAWVFVVLFGSFALYCLFTGKGKGRTAREKSAADVAWEEAVDSALKDCPFCQSKIIKSASECPYCGVLLEDIPSGETDAPDKNLGSPDISK
jgi:hypothetical protein